MKKIVVLGGGPCGIMASYQIKKNHPSYQVYLIDKQTIGKRIKVSGNGRCNFSNDNINKDFYYNGELIEDILLEYKEYEKTFYQEINLHYYSDNEGRRYPLTDSSKTVLDKLKSGLNKVGVIIKENEEFIRLEKIDNQYKIITSLSTFVVDKVIFAFGGVSQLYQKENYLNSINGIPYQLQVNNLCSSLCPIKVEEKIDKKAVGKRASAVVTVEYLNQIVYQEKGEIIFKKDGISGIVIFNVSSFLSNKKNLSNYKIFINFIDGINQEQITDELNRFNDEEVVSSYVVEEIKDMIISRYKNIYQGLSNFELKVKELYPLQDSQVTRGGINLNQLDLSTLSLKQDPNIYFGGEMIDVDGRCGGYNIFFAFASGYRISKSI